MGSKDKIRSFFEANVGKIVTTQQIRKVAGVSEYARRLRELRDEEGMQIKSHIDRHDLKPGQYILENLKRVPSLGRGISPQLRNEILERNGFTCQLCGSGPGDTDPFNPNRKIRLNIDHTIPLSQGGSNKKENLRVLCSACNLGRKNIQPLSESALNILARIRRLPRTSQKEVFDAMKKMFETK